MAEAAGLTERVDALERQVKALEASLAAVVSGLEAQEGAIALGPILTSLQQLETRFRDLGAAEDQLRLVDELRSMIWALRAGPHDP